MESSLEIRESNIKGLGVFALVPFTKGAIIKTLSGEAIFRAEALRRIQAGKENKDDPLQISVRAFIDLDELSRAFNHSCDPNAGIRKKNELFALRNISSGEEITYDYATTIGMNEEWEMSCVCRASNCRHMIGTVLSIPRIQLHKYMQIGALPNFIKEQSSEHISHF